MNKPYQEIIRFQGTIKDKITGENLTLDKYIKSKINYFDKLKQMKRIEKINNFLPECFIINQYFEKYFNSSPRAKIGSLSDDYEICKILSRLANYILYAHDAERITKKTKYNFYTEKEFWKKIKKIKSVNEIAENKNSDNENIDVDTVIDFLKRKNQNYKKQIKQKIQSKDLKKVYFVSTESKKNYPLKDYQKTVDYLGQQLKKGITEYKVFDVVENRIQTVNLVNMRNSMIDDQILTKDKLNGTIYFKDILPESSEIHWDMFDFFDKEHVIALLRLKPRNDSATDLDSLISDMESLLENIILSPSETEILELYRKDLTIGDIAKRIKVEPHIINSALSKICNKVIDKYEDGYENWYYLNIVKGKYKKCSVCGEIKFANERHFSKHPNTKDGLRPNCKQCDKI